MRGRSRRLLVALLAILAGMLPFGAGAQVVDARVGAHPDKTRFVLELVSPVPYRIFTLDQPYRVVIDLPEVEWRVPMTPRSDSIGVVSNFRFGLFQPGTSRLVIDATGPAHVREHFTIPPRDGKPTRLVIDLVAVSPDSFDDAKEIRSEGWQAFAMNRPGTNGLAAARRAPALPGRRVIVIDPGHGGVDPGAIGASGVYEKTVTLAASKVIKQRLEATGRYDVHLTRDRDIYLPLRERFQVAHARAAELFLSIHADSLGSGTVQGASIYTLSNRSSDRETALLAEKENKSDIIAGVDLSDYPAEVSEILIDFAQGATNEASWGFAELLVPELRKRVRLLNRPHRFAGFAVLKSPNVPSVLIEMGYLSNRVDERELQTRKYQEKFAEAILRAVDAFFERKTQFERS